VPDGAIDAVARQVKPGGIVLHCSGSRTVAVLRPHRPAGSFHPLMTFPGPEVALPDLCGVSATLAGDPEAIAAGRELADDLGMRAIEVPGDRRLYHCAAVVAGNFATVLLAEAARVLEAAGVPSDQAPGILAPLALASLRNAAEDPRSALTGPAVRGDIETIAAHRLALREAGMDHLAEMYGVLTESATRLSSAEIVAPADRSDS
jgi:predicted short-subunit dehydrogenase-like oxidoreductase (DUF2520 family)